MPKAKKFLILSERRETWLVRSSDSRLEHCVECGRETIWISCREAARGTPLTEREIFRLAESGGIHSSEFKTGMLFICGFSLRAIIGVTEGWIR